MRRFLRNTPEGKAMKPPIPFTLGGTLAGWWSADKTPGFSDNAVVPAIPDLSGFNRDWTQPAALLQPTFKVGVRNGKPAFRFAGTQYMVQDALAALFSAVPIQIGIFAAYATSGPAAAKTILSLSNTSSTERSYINVFADNGSGDVIPGDIYNDTTFGQAFARAGLVSPAASGFTYSGGICAGRVNGSATAAIQGTPDPIANLDTGRLGVETEGNVPLRWFFIGDLFELFVIVGQPNIAAGVTYLQNKYAI